MKPHDLDILRIPAFQRKRSLHTRLNKQQNFLENEQKKRSPRSFPVIPDLSLPQSSAHSPLRSVPVPDSNISISYRYVSVGIVIHYLDKIHVVIIRLTRSLRRGEKLLIEEDEGLFSQNVLSMQIDRKDVKTAKKGDEIGLKVSQDPKLQGRVYRIES